MEEPRRSPTGTVAPDAPAELANLLPQQVEGLCPACGKVKVTGMQFSSGVTRLPDCIGCQQRSEADRRRIEAEAATRQRRTGRAERLRRRGDLLAAVGVEPGVHTHCTLKNFLADVDLDAVLDMQQVVEDMAAGQRPNVYLWSWRDGEVMAPGTGKTHLIVGGAGALLVEGVLDAAQVHFVRETRLTTNLRELCGGHAVRAGGRRFTSPGEYVDWLIALELLCIDDLGKAKTDTPWMRELMFELVAGREARATWVTSNWSLTQLENRDEWYIPLASRLSGKGYVRAMSGPDRRPGVVAARKEGHE
jgi:DNA replication protein DnaC